MTSMTKLIDSMADMNSGEMRVSFTLCPPYIAHIMPSTSPVLVSTPQRHAKPSMNACASPGTPPPVRRFFAVLERGEEEDDSAAAWRSILYSAPSDGIRRYTSEE